MVQFPGFTALLAAALELTGALLEEPTLVEAAKTLEDPGIWELGPALLAGPALEAKELEGTAVLDAWLWVLPLLAPSWEEAPTLLLPVSGPLLPGALVVPWLKEDTLAAVELAPLLLRDPAPV